MIADTKSGIRAVLFDIDGTLTKGGPIWTPLLQSPEVGLGRKAWLYGTALPHHLISKAGLVSQAEFRDRWIRLMAWLMTGWPRARIQSMVDRLVQDMLVPDLRTDVVEILREHKERGRLIVLVSTMPHLVVEQFAAHVGADAGLGSVLQIEQGFATGRIDGETCSGMRKVDFARRYLARQGTPIGLKACAAYADSGADIPLLQAVGHPTAVYPDAVMQSAAKRAGWSQHPPAR